MHRIALALALLLVPLAARAQSEQQALVDRATLAAQEMLNERNGQDARYVLKRARAAMICPRVFRASFFIGGEGGECVLVARDAAGGWSYPAFYGLGSGSFGFQFGVQDAEVMMMIMTERGLQAVMDSQFKFGADASITFVTLGGGVEGATTAALRADIVAFARTRGLFAGIALQGSIMGASNEGNRAYYGRSVSAPQIVVDMQASNPGADPLRELLTRVGAPGPGTTPAPGGYQPPPPVYQTAPPPQPLGPVQQQPLPPPGRRY